MTVGTLPSELSAINIGLPLFAEALAAQDAPVTSVDWRAGGRRRGCDRGVDRAVGPVWPGGPRRQRNRPRRDRGLPAADGDDVARAGDVIDGLDDDGVLLHSGPPIAWERVCDPQRRAMIAAVLFEGWADDREAARGNCSPAAR